nr:integrase, catalytic region, zinc finger, CCHC-type, peptidase aspartic, catalytic [Tanacetum cinerariifolium]
NQKAKVSIKEIQMKYQPKVSKPKKVGTRKSLATPKPRKPRFLLRWSPTGKMFDKDGKIVDSRESKSQFDYSNGDNACTSNAMEPKIKRFPNSTSFLCIDSGCSKHMTGNLKLLINFFWKFMGTVRFRNDHVAAILGFGDLQWGNILITRVYFVEGLGHNLFSVGQFCDSELEVAFRRNACFVRNLEGVDLLKGDRSINLYTINLHEMASTSPICLIDRASSTKVYNSRTKKIMETMNVSFYELSVMAFEQCSSKPRLNSMTSGQISSGLDLIYAPSTITTQQPSEGELDLLFEAMYHDYISGQPSATARTVLPAQEPQVRQSSTASTT